MRHQVAFFLFLAGCHSNLTLNAPPLEGDAAFVLFGIEGGEVFMAHAVEEGRTALPPFNLTGDADLIAVAFSCSLGAVGLDPGPVVLDEAPLALSPLPQPHRAVRSSLAGGIQSPWSSTEIDAELRSILRRVRPPSVGRCPPLEIRLVRLPGTEDDRAAFALPWKEGGVLVVTKDGRFFEVGESSAVRLTDLSTTTPQSAGFTADSGEMFLVGVEEGMVRGTPEAGFTSFVGPTFTSTRGSTDLFVDGDPTGEELFVLSEEWALHHLSASVWQEEFTRPRERGPNRGAVVWLGPNRALAVGLAARPDAVSWIDGEEIRHESLPLPSEDIVIQASDLEGLGLVAGSYFGILAIAEEDHFSALGEVRLGVTSFGKLGERLLVGGAEGLVAVWDPVVGECPPPEGSNPFSFDDVTSFARLNDHQVVIVTTNRGDGGDVAVGVLSAPEGPACGG